LTSFRTIFVASCSIVYLLNTHLQLTTSLDSYYNLLPQCSLPLMPGTEVFSYLESFLDHNTASCFFCGHLLTSCEKKLSSVILQANTEILSPAVCEVIFPLFNLKLLKSCVKKASKVNICLPFCRWTNVNLELAIVMGALPRTVHTVALID
jgi:hypothetical protein